MRLRSTVFLLALTASAWAQTVVGPEPAGLTFTRTFPYSMAGKLVFEQGGDWFQGSGTLIRPSGVLTAAHNLWNADRGFSNDVVFRRSLFGDESAGDQYASRIYVLGSYREKARRYTENSANTFSEDLGAVLFSKPVANGSAAGWWANPALLLSGSPSMALGYGAQFHDGTQLLSVEAKTAFEQVSDAFYDNHSVYFEGGMSGGPVFARDQKGDLYVAGVVVAGAEDQHGGGIRILDGMAGAFIRTYLK